jgi:hypothetical protein
MNNFKKNIFRAVSEVLPPFLATAINWQITGVNPCSTNPWVFTDNNLRVRYNIENSINCGGTCNAIQAGIATATITVGSVDTNLGLSFTGIGELQDSDFEKIKFILDGVEVANAHAVGGGLGCQMGAVIQEYTVPSPYLLLANSIHTFMIDFTTNDASYHTGAFYQIQLNLTS